MRSVGESLVHPRSVEVPHGRPAHDPQPKWTKNGEVYSGVELLHESVLFRAGLDTVALCDGKNETLHQELAGEGEDDNVEGDESEVLLAFAVLCDIANVWWEGIRALVHGRVGVGEVDRWVERVVLAG